MRLCGLVIQRYGIYNPYTGWGASKGLLPHGPHDIRGHSHSQPDRLLRAASYGIQHTAEMVAKH